MTEKKDDGPQLPHPVAVKQVVAGTWREMVVKWLFDQSVPTVLLVAILSAIVYGLPQFIIPSIKDGYRMNAEALEKTTKLYLDARERETKLIMDVHERDRAAFERAINVMERRP